MTQRRILLVEDEQDIAELVALHLDDVCDEVVIASDGHEGMRLATSQDWSLIILDLRLPGPDLCDRIVKSMHSGVVSQDDGLATSDLTGQHRFDNPVTQVRIVRVN